MWITSGGQPVQTVEKRNMTQKTDIISAIATPRGKGAISCIRLSGEGSVALLSKLTGKPIDAFEHGKTVKCAFFAKVRDTIVAVAYLNGKSFTGEESAELFFHGGKFLTEQALYGILENGARLAEAGEFTRRAFLNGKIDLTQAEGIADLIDADSGDAAAQDVPGLARPAGPDQLPAEQHGQGDGGEHLA